MLAFSACAGSPGQCGSEGCRGLAGSRLRRDRDGTSGCGPEGAQREGKESKREGKRT